jgi:hypothetical protein
MIIESAMASEVHGLSVENVVFVPLNRQARQSKSADIRQLRQNTPIKAAAPSPIDLSEHL